MFSWRFVMFNTKAHVVAAIFCSTFLTACSNGNNEPEKKVEIKPAPKLTNDATVYAQKAWALMNQIDSTLYKKQITEIEEKVRKPLRQRKYAKTSQLRT